MDRYELQGYLQGLLRSTSHNDLKPIEGGGKVGFRRGGGRLVLMKTVVESILRSQKRLEKVDFLNLKG